MGPLPAARWRIAGCKLPSISITVTSSAMPRPSDSTMVGVSAPGRWILAMAMRSPVARARGACRARNINTDGDDSATARNTPAAVCDIDDRDTAVVGEQDSERGQNSDRQSPVSAT